MESENGIRLDEIRERLVGRKIKISGFLKVWTSYEIGWTFSYEFHGA